MALATSTRILGEIESGDPSAAEQLLPLVYDELRLWEQVRQYRETTLGLEHPATLAAMNNLALPYWAQARYAELRFLKQGPEPQ